MCRYIFIIIALLCVNVFAGVLRFGPRNDLNNVGVSLPIFVAAKQEPTKTPNIVTYKFTQGDRSWVEERLNASELWVLTQQIARWSDNDGNVQMLARMSTILPQQYINTDVQRAVFDNVITKECVKIDSSSDASLLAMWFSQYLCVNVDTLPQRVDVNKSRLSSLYKFKTDDPALYVYAFRFNKQYPGQRNAPSVWFALVIAVNGNHNDAVTERTIREKLLSGISSVSKQNNRAFSVTKNRSAPGKEYPFSVERETAQKSVENLDDWWYMNSDHYIMLSNNGNAEASAASLLKELEAIRKYFVSYLPMGDDAKSEVGVVRLFATTEEYITYLKQDGGFSGDIEQTAGIFSSGRRELLIRPVSKILSNKEGSIRHVLRHEGLHQYLFLAYGGGMTSAWFNEGLATFFEGCSLDTRGVLIIPELDRYTSVVEDLLKRKDVDWSDVLSGFVDIDYASFYANSEINYALGYTLMYYLLRGADLERNKPYSQIIPKYIEEFAQSKNALMATRKAFEGIDMRVFANRFVAFWSKSKSRQDAKRLPVKGTGIRR